MTLSLYPALDPGENTLKPSTQGGRKPIDPDSPKALAAKSLIKKKHSYLRNLPKIRPDKAYFLSVCGKIKKVLIVALAWALKRDWL